MTAFSKTILGRILKPAAKIIAPLAAVASFIIPAAAPLAVGGGILSKIGGAGKTVAKVVSGSIGGKVVGGVVKTLGVVGKAAVGLVTGAAADAKKEEVAQNVDATAAMTVIEKYQQYLSEGYTDAAARQKSGYTNVQAGNPDAAIQDTIDQSTIQEQYFARKASAAAGTAGVAAGAAACTVAAMSMLTFAGTFIAVFLIALLIYSYHV